MPSKYYNATKKSRAYDNSPVTSFGEDGKYYNLLMNLWKNIPGVD